MNAYVPILQSSGQVVAFMTQHLGLPIPSPALFDKIDQRFRRAVDALDSTLAHTPSVSVQIVAIDRHAKPAVTG